MGPRRVLRAGVGGPAVIAALAAIAAIGYHAFAPQDVLTRPTVGYPDVAVTGRPSFGELRSAPLVVDGRLRVYAEKWRVWSDAPVGGRYEATPYWALRRWPAQLVGVVAAPTPAGPVVVSHWSDGQVVALDARRGTIAWRVAGPDPGRGYDGRRTGARTVYQPDTLLTARSAATTVIIALGPGRLRAVDAATGRWLWHRTLPTGCLPAAWTGPGVVGVPSCAGAVGVFLDPGTGRELSRWGYADPTPLLCTLGRSGCPLMAAGAVVWRIADDGTLTQVPPLEPGARLAGDRVVYPTSTGLAARRLTDGTALWTWRGTGRLIAADEAGVYLLTDDLMVLGLNPASGHVSVVGCARSTPDERWQLGHVHPAAAGAYLALERLSTAADGSDEDRRYYYGPRPVAMVQLRPPAGLPLWSGSSNLAACRGGEQ